MSLINLCNLNFSLEFQRTAKAYQRLSLLSHLLTYLRCLCLHVLVYLMPLLHTSASFGRYLNTANTLKCDTHKKTVISYHNNLLTVYGCLCVFAKYFCFMALSIFQLLCALDLSRPSLSNKWLYLQSVCMLAYLQT